MEGSSELILRNVSRLPPADVLLVNPPADSLYRELQRSGGTVRVFTQNHGDYLWHKASGAEVSFGVLPEQDETPASVILHLPREKDLLVMMLHALSSAMNSKARLWLVGENKAGIKSAGRYLQRFFGQVNKIDSARHCGLFEAKAPHPTDSFSLETYATKWQIEYSNRALDIISLPGVFAHGRLDEGSRLLLEALEQLRPSGRILDFASGSGVIACALLSACPAAEVTLLDVSALAIEASRRTLEENALQAHLLPSDGLGQVKGRHEWIVSNPPFHRGVHNELEIAAGFFARAGTFLSEKGKIVIVCNRHLPYAKWLRNYFGQVEPLRTDDRFTVIIAGKPLNG